MASLYLFEYLTNPIDKSIHYTSTHAIDNHRAGDGEHLGSNAQDKSLCLC